MILENELDSAVPTSVELASTKSETKEIEETFSISSTSTCSSLSPLKSDITLMKCGYSDLMQKMIDIHDFDYINSNLNVEGNYESYVKSVLKSLIGFKELNFKYEIEKRSLSLPNNPSKSSTLILDIDETLVHTIFEEETERYVSPNCEWMQTSFDDSDRGKEIVMKVVFRPGLFKFLKTVADNFEVIAFTASCKEYADSILNLIDPNNQIFSSRLYRNSCIKIGKAYVKDLRIFRNRSLASITIIDNSMYSFANQLANGILVNSFYDDEHDFSLNNSLDYLLNYVLLSKDVRFLHEQVFRFSELLGSFEKANC